MNDSDLLVKALISYLTKTKKLEAIPEIIKKLKDFSKQEQDSAEVISSYDLTDVEKEQISEIINSKLEKVSSVKFTTDRTILGGIIIKYNDKMLDLSLSGKLSKIKDYIS